jgi:transcriptional regulator with PAS, ATPase and Fis domain
VPVNCGALPEGVLESELFGHVKGSFTGAIANKKGRFELADGGTLFLDEIGEISQAMQVKLLRAIEENSFYPVGAEKPIESNVRIVCASNKNLADLVDRGIFRDDLYYRLSVYPIELPPLRERLSDIPLLLYHFLDHYAAATGRKGSGFSDDALELLKNYRWPGNVRQLANTVQYALIKCKGSTITRDHLPPELATESGLDQTQRAGRPNKINRQIALQVLNRYGGNRAKAARELGVARSTLYRYLP